MVFTANSFTFFTTIYFRHFQWTRKGGLKKHLIALVKIAKLDNLVLNLIFIFVSI